MGWNLPTLAEMQSQRRAQPKGMPAVLEREEKRKSKAKTEKQCRKEVWYRDKGMCRATGEPLMRSGTLDPHKLGEVDHTILRSKDKTRIYDVTNMLLISKYLNRLRKVRCRNNGQFLRFDYDGPEDRGLPQVFTWRDDDGNITKTRIG